MGGWWPRRVVKLILQDLSDPRDDGNKSLKIKKILKHIWLVLDFKNPNFFIDLLLQLRLIITVMMNMSSFLEVLFSFGVMILTMVMTRRMMMTMRMMMTRRMMMTMRMMVVMMMFTLGKPLDLFNLPWSRPPAASPGLVSTYQD